MRAFWRWAAVEFELSKHPALALKMPKSEPRAVMPVTESEVRKLLEAAKRSQLKEHNAAIIVTLLDTGLRVSDIGAQARQSEQKTIARLPAATQFSGRRFTQMNADKDGSTLH